MSVLASYYSPQLNLTQTPASVSALFNASPTGTTTTGSTTPIYAAGGNASLPTPKPIATPNTSSPTATINSLLGDYANSYNQGIQANQQLYNNILSGYQNLYTSQMQGLQGYGQAQSNALAQQYAQQGAATAQQLLNSGLGNTTVMTAAQQGNNNQLALAQNQLAGQIQQQYLNTQQSNATNELNWMNSVSAQYPTLGQMGSLAVGLGQIQNSQPTSPYTSALTQALGLGGGIGLRSILGKVFGGNNNNNEEGGSGGGLFGGIGSLLGSLI